MINFWKVSKLFKSSNYQFYAILYFKSNSSLNNFINAVAAAL